MTIDPERLRKQLASVFFEEADENLETLETGLLHLEREGASDELLNEIFRAAHSLKGAAGSFGATEVTRVAHGMESLLEEFRSGTMAPNPTLIRDLIRGVDGLRGMLGCLEREEPIAAEDVTTLEALFSEEHTAESAPPVTAPVGTSWRIRFAPYPSLMHTGNDPLRLIRELGRLGDLQTSVDVSGLPEFDALNPEDLTLAWDLELETDAGRAAIEEVFSWVDDECELTIEESAPPAAEAVKSSRSTSSTSDSQKRVGTIRVGIDKIDLLMNMVGELVITQSMLGDLDPAQPPDERRLLQLSEGLSELSRNTRDLQESVMQIRSMPISMAFDRFPRLVYDLSEQFGKQVELVVSGETTELDRTVLERLGDPLVHLVRNSLDHGLETPEKRLAKDKSEVGHLYLNAFHAGGAVVVEIEDDGAGLSRSKILAKAIDQGLVREGDSLSDSEIDSLIFRPGFSTAETVSDISGRGVGMDVVRRNITELGGTIEVQSVPDKGTKFVVRLPLTLAIIEGQLVRIGDCTYVVPLTSIVESLQVKSERLTHIRGQRTYRLRDSLVPIVDLDELLGLRLDNPEFDDGLMVVAEGDGSMIGFMVDELQAQQQIVIKSLEANYERVEGLAGATILGDGNVAFILDIGGLVGLARRNELTNRARSELRYAPVRESA